MWKALSRFQLHSRPKANMYFRPSCILYVYCTANDKSFIDICYWKYNNTVIAQLNAPDYMIKNCFVSFCFSFLLHEFCCLLELRHAIVVLYTFSIFADDAQIENLLRSTRNISNNINKSYSVAKLCVFLLHMD